MQKLELKDFLDYQYLSSPAFSPDGTACAFVVAKAKTDESGYNRDLWLYDAQSACARPLTSGGDAGSFWWLDDNSLIFPAMRCAKDKSRAERGEPLTSFQRIRIDGGEAQPFFTVNARVNDLRVLDEDRFLLLCTHEIGEADWASLSDQTREDALKALEKEKDYEVLEEIPFWSNGVGFTSHKRARLCLYTRSTGALVPVTGEWFDVHGFSVRGQKVLFWGGEYDGKAAQTDGLFCFDAQSQEVQCVVPDGRFSISKADFWGEDIVFFASEMRTYGLNENPALFAMRNGEPVMLWDKDEEPGSNVGSDCRLGGGKKVCFDGDFVYYTAVRDVDTVLVRVNRAGDEEILLSGPGSVDAFALSDGAILFVGMRGLRLQELYELKNGQARRLTDFNEAIFANKSLSEPIPLSCESDGTEIHGFVMSPVGFDPQKTYPCILDIHGGPKTAYGSVFFHEMQVWANDGYFVVLCNPRGSDGRGNAFADIRGKYGTIDYDDLMRFLDATIAAYPQIDPTRLGVTGGSYGGFMTNWIIGHTQRFKAAASQRSIANWVSKFNTTDIGYYFNADQVGATPWSDPEKLWWHSPVRYANKAVTPTLFIHSDEDYRCWLAEGLQMFTALKYHGVEARLCLFHGENHELSRSGKPCHRVRRLEEITRWFDEHLKAHV